MYPFLFSPFHLILCNVLTYYTSIFHIYVPIPYCSCYIHFNEQKSHDIEHKFHFVAHSNENMLNFVNTKYNKSLLRVEDILYRVSTKDTINNNFAFAPHPSCYVRRVFEGISQVFDERKQIVKGRLFSVIFSWKSMAYSNLAMISWQFCWQLRPGMCNEHLKCFRSNIFHFGTEWCPNAHFNIYNIYFHYTTEQLIGPLFGYKIYFNKKTITLRFENILRLFVLFIVNILNFFAICCL